MKTHIDQNKNSKKQTVLLVALNESQLKELKNIEFYDKVSKKAESLFEIKHINDTDEDEANYEVKFNLNEFMKYFIEKIEAEKENNYEKTDYM